MFSLLSRLAKAGLGSVEAAYCKQWRGFGQSLVGSKTGFGVGVGGRRKCFLRHRCRATLRNDRTALTVAKVFSDRGASADSGWLGEYSVVKRRFRAIETQSSGGRATICSRTAKPARHSNPAPRPPPRSVREGETTSFTTRILLPEPRALHPLDLICVEGAAVAQRVAGIGKFRAMRAVRRLRRGRIGATQGRRDRLRLVVQLAATDRVHKSACPRLDPFR